MPDHKRLADMTLKERDEWTREQQKNLLEEDRKKDKKWKLGMIEESGYLCLGDTYVEPGKAFDDSSRTKGLNMKVPGIKLGRSEDKGKYFSQQPPICVGDPFMSNQDRKLVERKKGREIDEKNRIDTKIANAKRMGKELAPNEVDLESLKPWNPCGPQMKYDDLYLAEFDKTADDAAVYERLKKDKELRAQKPKLEELSVLKNITCNPLPRGGPGVVGTFPCPEWMPEPYREDEELSRLAKMKARKERSDDDKKPFKPVSIMKTNILDAVEIPKWIPASDKNDKTHAEIAREKRLAARSADTKKAWKPSNPMKKNIIATFPAIPDPDVKPAKKKPDKEEQKAWAPSSITKGRPCRSVATSRRNLGVFKANFFKKF